MAFKHAKWQSDFYGGVRWKQCRLAYSSYKGGLCEECYKRGVITPGTVVHHKVHMNAVTVRDDNLAYGFDNLELLCPLCHSAIHQQDKQRLDFPKCDAEQGKRNSTNSKRRWNVDAEGNLTSPPIDNDKEKNSNA